MRIKEKGRSFGDVMRELRERQGITVCRLAQLAGIHPSPLMYIEKYKASPQFKTVRRVARALGVPIDVFDQMMGNVPMPVSPPLRKRGRAPGTKVVKVGRRTRVVYLPTG